MNLSLIFSKLMNFLRKDPKNFYYFCKANIKGLYYVIFYRLFKKNIIIKLPFVTYFKIKICGPGSVFIDRGCSVFSNAMDGLTIATFSTYAQVNIGKGCDLGGVTIRCHKKIEIDDDSLFANCLIQDALYSESKNITPEENAKNFLSPMDVFIGKKVWLAGHTIILGGSKIGDGSVLSIGSLCFNREIPESNLAIGNPVFSSVSIEKIVKMVGNI